MFKGMLKTGYHLSRLLLLLIIMTAGECKLYDDPPDKQSDAELLLLKSDYQSSSISLFDYINLEQRNEIIAGLHKDVDLVYHSGESYIINKLGSDSITVLDKDFKIKNEFSTKTGSNPYDIFFLADNTALISTYDTSILHRFDLSQINPKVDENIIGQGIDLSRYSSDPASAPEMTYFISDNLYIYLLIQDIKVAWPKELGRSRIVKLSRSDLQSSSAVNLPFQNPVDRPFKFPSSNDIVITSNGLYGELDGAIFSYNPYNDRFETLLTELQAGGDFSKAILINQSVGFTIISTKDSKTKLIRFNLDNKSVKVIFESNGFYLSDIIYIGDKILCADANPEQPSVRVYDTDGELIKVVEISGLPPRKFVLREN